MNRLHQLSTLGQSVWIDFLSRDLIESGALGRAIADDAVVGVTSNPTIFEKALAHGGHARVLLHRGRARLREFLDEDLASVG